MRDRFHFAVSLRYELFFALQTLLDPEARVHAGWRERTLAKLPPAFFSAVDALGRAPFLFAVIADTLREAPVSLDVDGVIATLAGMDRLYFQVEVLCGAIHDRDAAQKLARGELSLKQALAKAPKAKREWLTFSGLYPYDAARPVVQGFERVVSDPEAVRAAVIAALRLFWDHAFAADWAALLPKLQQSLDAKRRLYYATSFGEFARAALLRIAVDDDAGVVQAIRGGYQVAFSAIAAGWLMPSAFNDKRLWSAYERADGTHVYFAYFDPELTLDAAPLPASVREPELDAALIMKALGDSTRFALATLLARAPRTSVELAQALGVSKPTISHHVQLLREAGLLEEQARGGSVRLTLRRRTVESLSALALRALYADEPPHKRKLSRSKS